jgi:hypothetical protein
MGPRLAADQIGRGLSEGGKHMRKALIAAAVATALFAVGAFAASFTVSSEDIASGTNAVEACATNVDVDFDDPVLNTTTGAWTVDGATVRFLDSAGAADNDCDPFEAQLAIDSGSGFASVGDTAVTGNTATFSFTAVNVELVEGASVVVDGATLTADLP